MGLFVQSRIRMTGNETQALVGFAIGMGDRRFGLWLPELHSTGTRGHTTADQDTQTDIHAYANSNRDTATNTDTPSNQYLFAHGYSVATNFDTCASNGNAPSSNTYAADRHAGAANGDVSTPNGNPSPCATNKSAAYTDSKAPSKAHCGLARRLRVGSGPRQDYFCRR
jgi:hypothetical protein